MQYSRGSLFMILPANFSRVEKYIVLKCQRPLWVINGHAKQHEKASALPPKADILFAAQRVR